jgi:hypothetical protein
MPQIFHRAFNTISVASILGVAVLAGLTGGGLYLLGAFTPTRRASGRPWRPAYPVSPTPIMSTN